MRTIYYHYCVKNAFRYPYNFEFYLVMVTNYYNILFTPFPLNEIIKESPKDMCHWNWISPKAIVISFN